MSHFPTNALRTLGAALLACLVPFAGAAADDGATLRAVVDQAIRPIMAEFDLPGVAVAVTVDGKPAFFNYGVASRESGAPVSEATLFELGSIGKTFTATLVGYAVAQGKLSLDAHPSQYLPQLKGSAVDKATLLHLGTYTAGGLPLQFPDDLGEGAGAGADDAVMLSYFRHWKADAAPGLQRRYSNPSLGLFGHVAGLAMHSSFADVMTQRIFPGLGLHSTYIGVPASAMPDYAWGYNQANQPGRVSPGIFADEAYGVKSSAADMIRYVQANIDPGALAAPLRRAVEATHVGYFQVGAMVQGLGWEQFPYPLSLSQLQAGNSETMSRQSNRATKLAPPRAPSGATLFDKTGSTSRFGAYVAFVPEKKIGVVILANKVYPIPARLKAAHAILAQLAQSAQ